MNDQLVPCSSETLTAGPCSYALPKRPGSPRHAALSAALSKRARLVDASPVSPLSTTSAREPSAPSLTPSTSRCSLAESAAVDGVVDLCAELLDRAGRDPVAMAADPDALARVLETEYSPKVAHLIFKIAGSLRVGDELMWHNPASERKDCDAVSDDRCAPDFGYDQIVPDTGAYTDGLSKVSSEEDEQMVPTPRHRDAARRVSGMVVPGYRSSREQDDEGDDRSDQPALAGNPVRKESLCAVREQPPDNAANKPAYKKDTEIALSRIFDLGKVAAVENPEIAPFDPYHGPSVVCMSGFGELGRFGNQVLQYAFLRVYSERHGISEVQVPSWVGANLFGLNDRPVQRALPAVVETREAKANSTFTTEFMDYIKASNAGHPVPEVGAEDLSVDFASRHSRTGGKPPVNVDFWGWFQWHSSCYAPFKDLIQDIFTPVPAIDRHMRTIFEREIRYRGGVKHTVVGLHLRLGDYQNISASSFGYCAPTSWYLELLERLWPTLDNPVLFVASDDIDAVLRDFSAYSPITADMAGVSLPASVSHVKAGFFPDWWSLTQCDVTVISNSTFSFTACMLNRRRGARFFRAHYADRMVEIDPWCADPIVHRDMSKGGLSTALSTLQVVYNTQGTRALVRNVLYELPYYGVRAAIMKAVLWRETRTRQAEQVKLERSRAVQVTA